jgi:hypothetical protein
VPLDNKVFLDFGNLSAIIESGYQAKMPRAKDTVALTTGMGRVSRLKTLAGARGKLQDLWLRSGLRKPTSNQRHQGAIAQIRPWFRNKSSEDNLTGLTGNRAAECVLPLAGVLLEQRLPRRFGARPDSQLLLRPTIFYAYSKVNRPVYLAAQLTAILKKLTNLAF